MCGTYCYCFEIVYSTVDQLQKANPDYGAGINPISRLIQIQQAKKEKEPVYSLVADKGAPKFHEFVMQVSGWQAASEFEYYGFITVGGCTLIRFEMTVLLVVLFLSKHSALFWF